jgi:hypothetical protein
VEGLAYFGLAILGLLALGLVGLTIWLVRVAKRRIGNWAYLLAPIPLLMLLLAGYLLDYADSHDSPPKLLSASGLSAFIKARPEYLPLSYGRSEFYKGKLYVDSNLGLLEMHEGKILCGYQIFFDKYQVLSGPWLDRANQLLWVQDDYTLQLFNFNGTVWHRVNIPSPQSGHFSRRDILNGIRPTGNSQGFWLEFGETVWRWNPAKNKWITENQPKSSVPPKYENKTIGVLPIGSKPLFIVRHETFPELMFEGQDFVSDTVVTGDGDWRTVTNHAGLKFFADTWVVTDESGYICTTKGEVLRVTPLAITKLDTPAACETVATTESGNLLASFRGKGIYEYKKEWQLRAVHPYPSGNGEYWAYLSGNGEELAIAIHGKPVADKEHAPGTDMFMRNAPTALWFSRGKEFQPIEIP